MLEVAGDVVLNGCRDRKVEVLPHHEEEVSEILLQGVDGGREMGACLQAIGCH
jgi:hypothetical protein